MMRCVVCGGPWRVERRVSIKHPPATLRYLVCKTCGVRWVDLQTHQRENTNRMKGEVRDDVSRR
jgi:hypothetical protein